MRMRIAFGAGFGLGYYLGAMAGRERYEQINRVARKVQRSEAFQTAEQKAKAAVDLGVERAKDAIDDKIHPNGADKVDDWPASTDPIVRP